MPYIGKSPTGSGVRQRYHFTATGGETSLSGADDNSKTLKFTDGEYVDVYLNGILLVQGTDYGVGTANTISSLAALAASDIVEVVVYDIYNVAKINSEAVRARHYYTATGGETSIGTAQIAGLSFAANAEIDVSLNGISLVAGTDYNTTTANTVGGLSALTAGQVVEIVIYEKFQLADALSKSAGGTVSGAITASGGLNVGTIKEATGTTTAMTIDSSGIVTPSNPVLFHIYMNANTALADTVGTVLPLQAAEFATHSFHDTTNNRITIPSGHSGYLFLSWNVRIDTIDGDNNAAYLRKNGSVIVEQNKYYTSAAAESISFSGSRVVSYTAGDYFDLFCFQDNPSSASRNAIAGAGNTFISGFKVG